MDLITSSFGGNKVLWIENLSGNGLNWTVHSIASLGGVNEVDAADFNGDCYPDVVATSEQGHGTTVYLNSGTQPVSWIVTTVGNMTFGPGERTAADVNGDGYLDVIGSLWGSSTATWYRNDLFDVDSDGVLWKQEIIDTIHTHPDDMHGADLDGDCDTDLVGIWGWPIGGLPNQRFMIWWENTDGLGTTWTTHELCAGNDFDWPGAIKLADLNGDGSLDILAMSSRNATNGKIAWWENLDIESCIPPSPCLNPPPVCDAGGPYHINCDTLTPLVQLNGSGSYDPSGGALTYEWYTDCPSAAFNDPTLSNPTLSIPAMACILGCNLTLLVSNGVESVSCTTSLSGIDNVAPALTTPGNVQLNCGVSVDPANTGEATASDTCDPAPVVNHIDITTPGSCPNGTVITRTWTATDACGNSTSGSQVITVVDNTLPVLNVPPSVTVQCDESIEPGLPVESWQVGYDFASKSVKGYWPLDGDTIDYSGNRNHGTVVGGATYGPGYFGQSYAFDGASVVDCGTGASLNLPGSLSFAAWVKTSGSRGKFLGREIDNAGPPFQYHAYLDPHVEVAVHNAQPGGVTPLTDGEWHHVTATYDQISGSLVIYVDGALNASANASIGFVDDQPNAPFTIGAITMLSVGNYGRYFIGSVDEVVVFDRPLTAIEVRELASDFNENQIADFWEEDSGTGQATATDNCDPAAVVTYSDVTAPGACPNASIITRTWTATDGCGNSTSATQVITVEDKTPPVLVGVPSDETVECDLIPEPPMVTAIDNCGGPGSGLSWVELETHLPTILAYSTATDLGDGRILIVGGQDGVNYASDSTSACYLLDTNTDQLTSAASLPQPRMMHSAIGLDNGKVLVVGGVGPDGIGSAYQVRSCYLYTPASNTPGSWSVASSLNTPSHLHDVVRLNDGRIMKVCGGSSSGFGSVACEVYDQTTGVWTPVANAGVGRADAATVVLKNGNVLVAGGYPFTSSVEVYDVNANAWHSVGSLSHAVDGVAAAVLEDGRALLMGGNRWDGAQHSYNSVDVYDPSTDSVSPNPALAMIGRRAHSAVHKLENGNFLVIGEYSSGNIGNVTTSCEILNVTTLTWSQGPNVNTARWRCPAVRVNGKSYIFGGGGPTGLIDTIEVLEQTSSLDCPVDYTETITAGSCPNESIVTRTWMATDACGNSISDDQIITVVDTTPPSALCKDFTAMIGPDGTVTITGDDVDNGSSDNCGEIVVGVSPDTFNCDQQGAHVVTLTVTDACGLTNTCQATVNVIDTNNYCCKPVSITCPPDKTVECDADISPADLGSAIPGEGCPGPSTVSLSYYDTVAPGACSQEYVISRLWKASDGEGNTDSCIQTITVKDTTPPHVGCPERVILIADENCQAIVPDLVSAATISDNCSNSIDLAVTQIPSYGSVIGHGITPLVIIATDECGNTATCTINVEVVDQTPPIIIPPLETTVVPIDCDFTVVYDKPMVVDNCDASPEISCQPPCGSILGPGLHTIVCSAVDASGNTSEATVAITVLEPLQVIFEQPPLRDDNVRDDIETDTDGINKFKVGSTIPVKIKILDCDGNDLTTSIAPAVTVRLDVTERENQGTTSTVVNDVPEDFNGVGDPESRLVLTGNHFQYNLDTDGFEAGTIDDPIRFFRVQVTVEYNTEPLVVVGEEDALLESK